jgi:hypothetical protein
MTENIEYIILQLEARLQAATLQNDIETADELLADNWLNINANGTITFKARSLRLCQGSNLFRLPMKML